MRFCLVQLEGHGEPTLAKWTAGGLVPLDGPPSLRGALEAFGDRELLRLARQTGKSPFPLESVRRWYPPVPDPRTFRDFYAFEQHVKTCRQKRGQEMIPTWYEIPVFYFSNTGTLRGHLEPVKRPAATKEMDFELEIACVIGRRIENVSGGAAEEAIFGYTVLNDLSARDLQRQEMSCLLGPAKGKDFATACGPYVVTPDELADVRLGPGRYDLTMVARKNGREVSRGNMGAIRFGFTQMIERASADVPLFPGDILGSGTVGTGCILELGPEKTDGWLEPGDTIELEIERLGTLTTPIV